MAVWLNIQAAILIALPCNVGNWPSAAIVQLASCTDATSLGCPSVERSYRNGRWFVLETANFQVYCEQSESAARKLARHAEVLRSSLCTKWIGRSAPDEWNPKCQIVLYPSQRSYVAAVGRGSERTVGSSLVKVVGGQVTARRIDLLEESTEYLSAALPHELTHVVLKDRFASKGLPRWADEGMAILADTEAKQERHNKDLRDALMSRTTFHAAELFLMDGYPPPKRFGAFYAQSASLTRFLVGRKGPQDFVKFIEQARENGFDTALRECFNIANAAELDRQWRQNISLVHRVAETDQLETNEGTDQADVKSLAIATMSVGN
jgi:hypothetical protein